MNGEPHNGGIMPRCIDVIFNSVSQFQAKKNTFKPDRMNGFEIQDESDAVLTCQNELGYFNQALRALKTPRKKEAFGEGDALYNRTPDDGKIDSVDEDNMYAVFVTYIEIYNNNVHDLLDDTCDDLITRKLQNKVIREDGNRNMYVHAVTEVEVKSPEEAFEIFYKGQRRKRMAHTNLNEESSRSHSIFTIRLVQAPIDSDGENVIMLKKYITVSQLSLVDLAGSERTNRTKNTGQRLREAGNINNSLMSLRTCLEILRENQQNGTNKMVPYRDSKLTHLFKNFFDGEGQVRVIVCVNPKSDDYDETVHVLKFAEMTQEVQVPRPVASKPDIGLTPGRRRAALFAKKSTEEINPNTELKELDLDAVALFNLLPGFPRLNPNSPDDEESVTKLRSYLEQRLSARAAVITELNTLQLNFRKELIRREGDFVLAKQENIGIKGTLQQERKRYEILEKQIHYFQTEMNDLRKKVDEKDQIIRHLQQAVEDKDMIISQQTLDKEKVKEKCVSKIAAAKEKMTREMKMKLSKELDEYQTKMRDQQEKFRMIRDFLNDDTTPKVTPRPFVHSKVENIFPRTPQSTLNTQGTLYMPPNMTPSQGHISRRGFAVSNPRHRRSRSAGAGEVWLDHKPATAVELNTVFQPSMKKRKSVTKLTDVKDIVNSKTSKYCLTTQEQDTDGELETKLYKGDVIPTSGGGAQVILNDVELLKQLSPTSEMTSRKRSFPDVNNENTELKCAVSIEGHSKRPKS
ncbi:UNVERIFIED_CONTAM: hypothetical protein PYX00_000301 [Menopon gallinae]